MNEPKIRFKWFCGEWKNTTFGAFGSVAMCRRIFKEQTSERGDVPFYNIGTFGKEPDAYISRALYEDYKAKYPYPQKGDILISAAGTIGRTVEYEGEDSYFQDSNIVWIKHSDELDNKFLKQLYSIVKWSSLEGATIQRLYNSNILETEVNIPFLPEQRALASFFTSLDAQISASTSRLASLKQVKAASLQAMFPQEGETVPKVRFKGFQGEWKKVKLGEIATFSKGNGYSKNDLQESGHPIILYGRLYTKYQSIISNVDTYTVLKDGSVLSKGNEIIMPASGETPEDIARASAVQEENIILGGDLNVMRFDMEKYSTPFIALAITYTKTHYDLSRVAQGKSVVHLHNEEISNAEIMLPLYAEQQSIASFFTSLDRQITLQSKRLEKLKQIKAACLDKMFV